MNNTIYQEAIGNLKELSKELRRRKRAWFGFENYKNSLVYRRLADNTLEVRRSKGYLKLQLDSVIKYYLRTCGKSTAVFDEDIVKHWDKAKQLNPEFDKHHITVLIDNLDSFLTTGVSYEELAYEVDNVIKLILSHIAIPASVLTLSEEELDSWFEKLNDAYSTKIIKLYNADKLSFAQSSFKSLIEFVMDCYIEYVDTCNGKLEVDRLKVLF